MRNSLFLATVKTGSYTTSLRGRFMACLAGFTLLVSLAVLSGCSSMFAPATPASIKLNPAMPGPSAGAPLKIQLAVSKPHTGSELHNDAIILVFGGNEVQALAGARWANAVPFTVQRGLIGALQATGAFAGVADNASGVLADVRLLTELEQFNLRYATEDAVPVAVFEANFRLVSVESGKILATTTITTETPAAGKDTQSLARAVESAFAKALASTSEWAVTTLRAFHN